MILCRVLPSTVLIQPRETPDTQRAAVDQGLVERDVPACKHYLRVEVAGDMFNEISVSTSVQVKNLPNHYVLALVELLTTIREQIPGTRSIETCCIDSY